MARGVSKVAALALVAGLLPLAGTAQARVNPCTQAQFRHLRCPDLVMKRPADLQVQRLRDGRVLLRSTSSIDNVGDGPIELLGRRVADRRMSARQRIERRGAGAITVATDAVLGFKDIPGQGGYWKLRNAARLEVWSVRRRTVQLRRERVSPKLFYCLRDLRRTLPLLPASPAQEVFPACNQDPAIATVRLGTSVGWSDIYPAPYFEQYVDVTGLVGRFALVHVADPEDVLFEGDETNNASRVIVRLPSGTVVG